MKDKPVTKVIKKIVVQISFIVIKDCKCNCCYIGNVM